MMSSSLKKFIKLENPMESIDPQEFEIIEQDSDDRGLSRKIFKG